MPTRVPRTPFSVVAFALMALAANPSSATVVTTGCADASFCTIPELFDLGTIQVDDKLFHGWSGEKEFLGQTRVYGLDDDPLNPGIQFRTGLFAQAGNKLDIDLDFTVSVVGSPLFIKDNSLDLVGFEIDALDGLVQISEIVTVGGVGLAFKQVHSDGETEVLSDTEEFAPQTSIHVGNRITLEGGAQKGDFVKLTIFEQRFSQTEGEATVPEPSAALLFAGGALLTFRAVQRRRRVSR